MGGSSSNGGGGVESPNNLVSDQLLKIQDLLCEGQIKGFHTNAGQYGADPLTSTFFNDVVVRNQDGSYNFNVSGQGFEFAWVLGTPTQFAMTGFEKVTCQVPLPQDTRLSNPPINAGLPKTLLVTFNTQQYPDANSVLINYRIPSMYAVSTNNGAVNGFEVDTQIDCSLNNGPFQSLSGGTQQFVGKNTTPYFRTYQYVLPTTVPAASNYQWTLRFTKTSQDVLSTSVQDDIYVDSVSVISASQYNYPNTAMVGLFVDALQFGSVPSRAYLIDGLLVSVPSGYTPTSYVNNSGFLRNCVLQTGDHNINMAQQTANQLLGIITGLGVTGAGIPANSYVTFVNPSSSGVYYFSINNTPTINSASSPVGFTSSVSVLNPVQATYPNVWNGTFQTGVWTNNPAWCFYDILSNTRYGLGQYVNTANIDIWTLYQIGQYCDQFVDAGLGDGTQEPQFTLNAFIKDAADAYEMLLNLSSVFRGMLYYANGTVKATLADNQSPVFNYANANVIGGQFHYSSTARSARHNAVQVKYTDPNNLYRDNFILIEDNQGIIQYGYNKKEISAFGCSSVGQATRVANYILTTERLRTETVTFQVAEDSLYVRPGDIFNLYDNFRMNRSQGGRVQSFDATQQFVTLDRPVNLDSGVIYALTCTVPALNISNPSSITGSNQIPLIQNPQIQSCVVLNGNTSGIMTLQVSGGFSGLSKNAVWILSASGVYTSGYVPTVFEQAPQYQCLNITESSPGMFDVVGLQYNTGINYTINTGFSVIMNPTNSGDSTNIQPPTNFTGAIITGQLSDLSFYEYANMTWTASPSSNTSYYVISGDAGSPGSYIQVGRTTSTGFQYISTFTGNTDFKICAVSKGGVYSAAQSATLFFPTVLGVDRNQIRFWALPAGFGDLEQVGVFYNRPQPAVTNTRIFYATGNGAPFREVLDQTFFPALGASISGLTTSGTTVYFNSNSYDMPSMASQGAYAQAQNTLLFLIDNELMSVGTISGVGTNQFAFTVNRGVMGTAATTHSAITSGYMFYNADLSSFSDASLVQVFNGTGYDTGVATRYFQIQNITATLDGTITPPSPGISYTLPNPLPGVPGSLTANNPGGPIVNLLWTAPPTLDTLQYQIFRAVSPFSVFNEIATTSAGTFFSDISVSVGTTYEYYVVTEAQDEQTSPHSNTVTITPTGAPLVISPPANPTAPTLNTEGIYFSQDANIFAFLTFNVAAMPAGAAGQYLLYRINGQTNWMIANDISNVAPTTASINDLTPNTSYDVSIEAYSIYGTPSSIITATSSPFTAPGTNTCNPPTSVGISAPVYGGSPTVPPVYYNGVTPPILKPAYLISWTLSVDTNIAFYEYYLSVPGSPPNPTDPIDSNQTVPGGQNYAIGYNAPGGLVFVFAAWVRAINKSGVISSWVQSAGSVMGSVLYAGNMGGQAFDSAQIQGVEIGNPSDPSVQPINATYGGVGVYTILGSSPTETFSISIANRGFTAAPTQGVATPVSSFGGSVPVSFYYDQGNVGNSSTTAYFVVYTNDGSNLHTSNGYAFSFTLTQS